MTKSQQLPAFDPAHWTIQHLPENKTLPDLYLLQNGDDIMENTSGNSDNCMFFHEKISEECKNSPTLFLGATSTHNLWVIDLPEVLSTHFNRHTIRQALMASCEHEAPIIKIAASLISWNRRYRFCFTCGHQMQMANDERAKVCPQCAMRCYPHVSPCVIMAIRRENHILLARHSGLPNNIYSTLAGFIEPGESAEEAVRREVMEEVGITVKNIEYAASQAWPFPSQLMLGFLCEHESGELTLNTEELEDGKWFHSNSLPALPGPISIAHFLIRETLQRLHS